jgi:hypothetical protein
VLLYTADNRYESVINLTIDQRKLFTIFDMEQDDIEYLARDFNNRNKNATKNQERKLPEKKEPLIIENSHKRGPKKSVNNGSVDNSTSTDNLQTSAKSKGGRPKGKKDTKLRKSRSFVLQYVYKGGNTWIRCTVDINVEMSGFSGCLQKMVTAYVARRSSRNHDRS